MARAISQSYAASPTPASSPRDPRRVIVASLIGTTIEWYDFFLYGTAAALVFNKLFFPQADPLTGAMLAFATYALGFIARPVGGLVFGHFGDRIGRKRLLMLSLVLMGVSSSLIGLLPTYGQVGVAAPLLLTALRLVQGFAVGGEWGGAGADGGVRRRQSTRDVGGLAPGGRAGRQPAGRRRARRDGRRAGGSGFPRLGLARPVPAVRRSGGVRLVGALARRRESGFRSRGRQNRRAGNRRRPWRPSRRVRAASPSARGCGWGRMSRTTSSPPSRSPTPPPSPT